MPILINTSLLLNILVLAPVCFGLLSGASWTGVSYWEPTQARAILLSVYLSIFVVSAILILIKDPQMIAALLSVQVIYKMTTPFTGGIFGNPVVISNILI